ASGSRLRRTGSPAFSRALRAIERTILRRTSGGARWASRLSLLWAFIAHLLPFDRMERHIPCRPLPRRQRPQRGPHADSPSGGGASVAIVAGRHARLARGHARPLAWEARPLPARSLASRTRHRRSGPDPRGRPSPARRARPERAAVRPPEEF